MPLHRMTAGRFGSLRSDLHFRGSMCRETPRRDAKRIAPADVPVAGNSRQHAGARPQDGRQNGRDSVPKSPKGVCVANTRTARTSP